MNLVNNEGGPVHADPALLDQDDSTCIQVIRNQRFYMRKTESFIFTWMMLVTKGIPSHARSPFSVTAKSHETSNRLLNCNQRQRFYGNTVHIYCDFQAEKVWEVEVQPTRTFYLCSWYISGGRNVALRQNTSQSTVYSNRYSKNGVDGDTTNMCAGTIPDGRKHVWSLRLARPMMIQRIRLYSFKDGSSQKYVGNDYYQLSLYNQTGYEVYRFKDPGQSPKPPYYTYRFRRTLLARIEIEMYSAHPDTAILFCELQAWGDCPGGYYGLDCIKRCPELCPKSCNIFDGQCDTICSSDNSGVASSRTCPVECMDDCDPETGQCPEASSTGTPVIVFLIITTLGIVSALSIATFKLMKREEPQM